MSKGMGFGGVRAHGGSMFPFFGLLLLNRCLVGF